ncbi:MAG: hypothetical protein GX630_05000 [Actinobacteria bacterium]|nr:hypothetical protein [Actinomycetota bacterium]
MNRDPAPRGAGGNLYLTQSARVGRRFARALIARTLQSQTLHGDAFRLLGISKLGTFRAKTLPKTEMAPIF